MHVQVTMHGGQGDRFWLRRHASDVSHVGELRPYSMQWSPRCRRLQDVQKQARLLPGERAQLIGPRTLWALSCL
jgi:hypothetical protein